MSATLFSRPYFQQRPPTVPPFEQAALAIATQATGRQAQVAALQQTYAPITTELYGPASTPAPAAGPPWDKIALVAGGAGLLVYLIRRRSA